MVDGGNGILHLVIVGQDVRDIIPKVLIEPFRLKVELPIPKVLNFSGEVDFLVVAFCLKLVYAVAEMLQLRGFPFIFSCRCRAVIGRWPIGVHVPRYVILIRPQDFIFIILNISIGIMMFLGMLWQAPYVPSAKSWRVLQTKPVSGRNWRPG